MAISRGERIPDATVFVLGDNGPEPLSTRDYMAGRKVVVFAIPGAFTPTCHARHIPSYLEHLDALKAAGVDAVAVMAVNDPFVLAAALDQLGARERLDHLADGNGAFTAALGLELDGSGIGLGRRAQRFAMIVNDGVVEEVFVEPDPGQMTVSSADNVLRHLRGEN